MLGPYYGERYGNRGLTAYDPYRRGDLTAPTVWPTDLINFGDMGQLRNFNKSMSSILSADLIDKGNSYEVHVDLPGIAKEDLEGNRRMI
jgi:HSP20 family molecular chaperone IbpA